MKQTIQKTYLLIHGAWHGSWCFNKYITPGLEKTGSKVYTCDLPGHFHNKHYNFKGITLDTYVDYLSAFIPSRNGSLIDEEKKSKFPSVALKIKIDEANCSIALNTKDAVELFYQNCKEKDIRFAEKLLQNQPLLPFVSKVSLGENFDGLHKTYIECLQDKAIHTEDQRRMNVICDKIISIDPDHLPFFSTPQELINIPGETISGG